ncbi:MAG: diguanylate cyclase [Candidatus Acidiferrales bacterium]
MKSDNRRARFRLAGLLTGLLLLGITGYASILSKLRADDAAARVSYARQVQVRLARVQAHLGAAESAAELFLVNGDDSSQRAAQIEFDQTVAEVTEIGMLSQENPGQQRHAAEIEALLRERVNALKGSRGITGVAISARAEALRGRDEFQVRTQDIFKEMENEDEDLLARSEASTKATARNTTIVLAVGTALAILLFGAASHSGQRELEERIAAETRLHEETETFRAILSGMGDGVVVCDENGRFQHLSPAAEAILGTGALGCSYRKWPKDFCICQPHGRTEISSDDLPLARALRGDSVENVQLLIRGPRQPQGILVNASARPLLGLGGKLRGAVLAFRDVTEQFQASERVKIAQEYLAGMFEEAKKRAEELKHKGELIEMIQSCQSSEEAYPIIGKSFETIFPGRSGALAIITASRSAVQTVMKWGSHPTTEPVFSLRDCWALRRGHVHLSRPSEPASRCRHLGVFEGTAACIPVSAQGETLGVMLLENDAAEDEIPRNADDEKIVQDLAAEIAQGVSLALANLELREKLRTQSILDPLTGLYNRRYMEESLEREIYRAARGKHPLSAILLDLDQFKTFNDSFGHDAGDFVLRELGQTLRKHVRGEDIACRYGGEEFALILPEANVDIALRRVAELSELCRHMILHYEGQMLGPISFSAGVANYPIHADSPQGLLRTADAALYRAKSEGRSRVVEAESVI